MRGSVSTVGLRFPYDYNSVMSHIVYNRDFVHLYKSMLSMGEEVLPLIQGEDVLPLVQEGRFPRIYTTANFCNFFVKILQRESLYKVLYQFLIL